MTHTEAVESYATERYRGANGLNWWRCDPTLQFLMRYHLTGDELTWAEPHLDRMGALMGGPVSERAEITRSCPPVSSVAAVSGVSSSTTWALVPPTPNELTPARRGSAPRGQGLSRLKIACAYPRASIALGASIACSGVCLTEPHRLLNRRYQQRVGIRTRFRSGRCRCTC